MSIMLHGIGVAKGIAIGKAYLMEHGQLDIAEYTIPEYLVDPEIDRFNAALEGARDQLIRLRTEVPAEVPGEVSEFIEAHLLMLEDSAISRAPVKHIRRQHCNAEWALKQQRDTLVQVFDEMEDPYLRTRKDDIDHVINRIMNLLLEQENDTQELLEPDEEDAHRIIVTDSLTAADILLYSQQQVAGIITEHGAPNSHSAILARSLHIPTVMGAGKSQRYLQDGEPLIINGESGIILINSDPNITTHYQQLQQQERLHKASLSKLRSQAAITRDYVEVSLQANVELSEEIKAMRQAGCRDIGLFRTEFLFLNRDDLPSEEEQYEVYRSVIEELDDDASLTIRTLDIGTDKFIPAIVDMESAENPALGLRAIRLSLKHIDLLVPQIRAILRASAHGHIRLMVPMVTNLHEVVQIQNHVEQEKRNLKNRGIEFDPALPVGAMIETPAAALAADGFAQRLDFLSIGTNDLSQYTLAIDRTDDQVNYLFDPLHPSALRLINHIIQAGLKYQTPVSLCGELAGDDRYTRLLLGMGLREFSMGPSMLTEVKQAILNTRLDFVEPLVEQLLETPFHDEISRLAEEINRCHSEHG